MHQRGARGVLHAPACGICGRGYALRCRIESIRNDCAALGRPLGGIAGARASETAGGCWPHQPRHADRAKKPLRIAPILQNAPRLPHSARRRTRDAARLGSRQAARDPHCKKSYPCFSTASTRLGVAQAPNPSAPAYSTPPCMQKAPPPNPAQPSERWGLRVWAPRLEERGATQPSRQTSSRTSSTRRSPCRA